jgi:hypothetical protein
MQFFIYIRYAISNKKSTTRQAPKAPRGHEKTEPSALLAQAQER